MHEAIFADVEIARAGAAAPLVGASGGDVVLEAVDARVASFFHRFHGVINAALFFAERHKLSVAVVNDADGGGEAEGEGALSDDEGVVGILDAAADDGVDVDVEVGVFGEQLKLLVENLERLLADFVGGDVVDGNLHMLESGAVEALDALGSEQISVGDHAGDDAVAAHATDDVVELGVKQRLATADGDDGGAERTELVDTLVHGGERNGVAGLVELVAVGAGEIAAAHRDDVRQHGVVS